MMDVKNPAGYKTIKPAYFDNFACAMAACEDNCCNLGWNIYIDKQTYHKYKGIKNPEFARKVSRYIERVKGEAYNDFYYACIATAKEGYCPFQTAEGLCEIHRDYGEQFLSTTCKSYPRNARRMTDEYLELSVSMSCPEAVRVALFDEAPMEFIVDEVPVPKGSAAPAGEMRPEPGAIKTNYIEYGWLLREASITIMQNRSCPVAYRIIIIAMMLSEVVELHDGGRAAQIPGVLDYYCGADFGEAFIDGFKDTPRNEEVRLNMNTLLYYTIRGESAHPRSSKFAQLIERFDRIYKDTGISSDMAVNAAEFHVFTTEAICKHWDSFLDEFEHILENYLVSYMFTELFPLTYHGEGLNPYHHSLLLAEQYAVLRILLCCNFDPGEGFSRQYIVQAISQVAVINQHSKKSLKVAESYKNAGIDTPAHLYYLLT